MLRNGLPLIIVFVTAMLLIVAFFIPHKPFGDLESRFLNWYSIVAGFTFLLGLDSLTRHHLVRVIRRREGWFYSLMLVLSLFTTLALGFYSWIRFKDPFSAGSPFDWLYRSMIIPLQSTMFATLAFFIVSAAFRAFRVRNLAATLLLVAACLVMIGNVPVGSDIWHAVSRLAHSVFPRVDAGALGRVELFATVKDWLMKIAQTSAMRGIGIGLSLGGIAMSLRIILGIERTYLSS
ncbi:hypothetical protein FJY71_01065 [candidate division WOR-3 bacterium]|nr:hypothetical protein [candidate division WOR-3 bacterium]